MFRSGSEDQHIDRWIPKAVRWVHEAGNPYYDWFFGGSARAESALAAWMRRPSSEVFVGRIGFLMPDGRAAGGFIALSGGELADCRRADALAAMQTVGPEERGSLLGRMRSARDLFTSVAADEFYLSKMGVVASYRGVGYGARLVTAYLEAGAALGFQRFRLDVWAGNRPAISLYQAAGFRILRESSVEGRMTYLGMGLEIDSVPHTTRC